VYPACTWAPLIDCMLRGILPRAPLHVHACAAAQVDPGTIYDIFDNLTDVQTVMWRDAVYVFRRRREGEACQLTLRAADSDKSP